LSASLCDQRGGGFFRTLAAAALATNDKYFIHLNIG
jgi:hypothetical protein